MLITTTENIPGKDVYQVLGMVRGNTVRSKNVFRDIGAGLKTLVGGEIRDYTQMLIEAREEALFRMSKKAEEMGANAVVMVRFATSSIMGGAAEILAYGTAVKIK
ncbi:MAG: YbjQ family protein [Calditrichaeota bacterium]|nr:YbjQ family protein [Calditrichota bacterium]